MYVYELMMDSQCDFCYTQLYSNYSDTLRGFEIYANELHDLNCYLFNENIKHFIGVSNRGIYYHITISRRYISNV